MSGRIPDWWQAAHDHLAEDALLGPVVAQFGPDGGPQRLAELSADRDAVLHAVDAAVAAPLVVTLPLRDADL